MASAGRILILPKGTWNVETEYEMLDLVSYNGRSWLAKKNAVGIEPIEENSEYWQDMFGIDLTPYATKEELSGYLSKKGGTLSGELGLNNGKGTIYSNDNGTFVQSRIDGDNYRYIRVERPTQGETPDNWVQISSCVGGTPSYHNLFGEHNIDLLKRLLGLN